MNDNNKKLFKVETEQFLKRNLNKPAITIFDEDSLYLLQKSKFNLPVCTTSFGTIATIEL